MRVSRIASSQSGARAARIQLLSSDEASGSRLLGAQLMGDYYLTGQGNGLRLSGGLMVGPQSLLGSGLAPTRPGLLGVGHRRLLGNSDETSLHQPYLGVGFSRYGAAWGFSADAIRAIDPDYREKLGLGPAAGTMPLR